MSIYDPPMSLNVDINNTYQIPEDSNFIGAIDFKIEIQVLTEKGVELLVSNILDEFKNGNYKNNVSYKDFIEKKLYKNKLYKTRTLIYEMIREVMISKGIEIFAWTTIRNIIFTNRIRINEFNDKSYPAIGMLGINDFDYLFHDISQIVLNDNPIIKVDIGSWNAFSRYFRKQWGIYHHISRPDLSLIRRITLLSFFLDHYEWFVDKKFYKDYFDLGEIFKYPKAQFGFRKDCWGVPYPKDKWGF